MDRSMHRLVQWTESCIAWYNGQKHASLGTMDRSMHRLAQWTEACIAAIHQKGAKNERNNYRSVTPTSVIYKKNVSDFVVVYMMKNGLFIDE